MADILLETYQLSIKHEKTKKPMGEFKAILRDKVLMIISRQLDEAGINYSNWSIFNTRLFNSYQFVAQATTLKDGMSIKAAKLKAVKRSSPIAPFLELTAEQQSTLINATKAFRQYRLILDSNNLDGVEFFTLFELFTHQANNLSGICFHGDGTGYLGKGSIKWDSEGNGQLAWGNISWGKEGDLLVLGKYATSKSGQRFEIDPEDQALKMYNSENKEALRFFFSSVGAILYWIKDGLAYQEITPIGSTFSGYFSLPDLPTSDPEVKGRLWRNGTDLKISLG